MYVMYIHIHYILYIIIYTIYTLYTHLHVSWKQAAKNPTAAPFQDLARGRARPWQRVKVQPVKPLDDLSMMNRSHTLFIRHY